VKHGTKARVSSRLTLFSENNNDVTLFLFFLQIHVMLVKNRVAFWTWTSWVCFLNWL